MQFQIRLRTRMIDPSRIWEGTPSEIAANITGSINRIKPDPENGFLSWQPITGTNENAVKWLKENQKLERVSITCMVIKKGSMGSFCETSLELVFEPLT